MNKMTWLGLIGALALASCAPTMSGNSGTTTDTTMAAGTAATTGGGTTTDTTASGTANASGTVSASAPGTGTSGSGNSVVTKANNTFTLAPQPSAPSGITPTGMVMTTFTSGQGTVMTTATLSGLAPSTFYVAHYHLQGKDSANPCASNGTPILESKLVGQTDTTGTVSLTGTVPASVIQNTTYFNVHTATGPDGTPADAGVACTSVQ